MGRKLAPGEGVLGRFWVGMGGILKAELKLAGVTYTEFCEMPRSVWHSP